MRCKQFALALIGYLALTGAAQADNYKVNVSLKSNNMYEETATQFLIYAPYCYEYVYGEDAYLRMAGYSGEMIFPDSGNKCDVDMVYKKVTQSPGRYRVTVSRKHSDWYEILGLGMFIKTGACISIVLGEDAVLDWSGAYGTLYVDGDECMAVGIYSKVSL